MPEVQQSHESVVVTLDQDVTSTNAQDFRHTIFAIIQQGGKDVVIDLQHVVIVDSTGIGVLISAQNALRVQGGSLKVIHASPDILRLFKVLRLDAHIVVEGCP